MCLLQLPWPILIFFKVWHASSVFLTARIICRHWTSEKWHRVLALCSTSFIFINIALGMLRRAMFLSAGLSPLSQIFQLLFPHTLFLPSRFYKLILTGGEKKTKQKKTRISVLYADIFSAVSGPPITGCWEMKKKKKNTNAETEAAEMMQWSQ